jgi:hypothetical protein
MSRTIGWSTPLEGIPSKWPNAEQKEIERMKKMSPKRLLRKRFRRFRHEQEGGHYIIVLVKLEHALSKKPRATLVIDSEVFPVVNFLNQIEKALDSEVYPTDD